MSKGSRCYVVVPGYKGAADAHDNVPWPGKVQFETDHECQRTGLATN